MSERITVRSIVGRFLEHSRLFWFANAGEPRLYIGSADLMERNLDRRVEVLCPIGDRRLSEHLLTVVLEAYRRDNRRCHALDGQGVYAETDATPDEPRVDSQELLADWYSADSRREREATLDVTHPASETSGHDQTLPSRAGSGDFNW